MVQPSIIVTSVYLLQHTVFFQKAHLGKLVPLSRILTWESQYCFPEYSLGKAGSDDSIVSIDCMYNSLHLQIDLIRLSMNLHTLVTT